jgi:hypothetical protein
MAVAKAAAVVVRRPVLRRMACRWLVRLWVPLHCRVPWLSLQLSLTGSVGSHLLVLVPGAGMALIVNVNPSVLIGIRRPVVVVKVSVYKWRMAGSWTLSLIRLQFIP